MRVLVIGGGGREHALAWKLSQSPEVDELFMAPGNAGMASLGSCVPIHHTDIVELADFAAATRVDLTVVGPELPLTLGIVDEFRRRDLCILGPSRDAAELEGSKVFSKRFMQEHGIPTADFRVAGSMAEATAVMDSAELGWPLVIKADGLAAGKGVIIAKDRTEAEAALKLMLEDRVFGSAADQVLLEACLEGFEASFHVVADGEAFFPLASSQDYKRVGDGGEGPNTGGMGTVSPSPRLTGAVQAEVLKKVVLPTLKGMKADGRAYQGFLYVGIMLTADGPKVIEYNCRLGDPETQVILPRLDGDLYLLLKAAAEGRIADAQPKWHHLASTCVVMCSEGYPGKPTTGRPITGLEDAEAMEGVTVFHAATKKDGDDTVTVGGRVLGVTALARDLETCRNAAYAAVGKIAFEGGFHRKDIGTDVIEFLKQKKS